MKKFFQNGINLFITLILLFSLAPLGAMAQDRTTVDENVPRASNTTTQCKDTQSVESNYDQYDQTGVLKTNATTEMNVAFTNQCLSDFTVNSLTATRSGSNIIFTLNYQSSRIGGYSFFNPPNGDLVMKYDFSGIKTGANTLKLTFTQEEFKKILSNDTITMKFWIDNTNTTASWIFFKTDQLSILNDTEDPDSDILPNSISLNKSNVNLSVNTNEKITATLSPSDTTDKTITWASSDSSTATVDSNGTISGIKAGTATITATTVNKLIATCTVVVTSNDPENPTNDILPSTITLDKSAINLNVTNSQKITPTLSPSDATDKTITWASSDSSIATVDSTGTVTGIKSGTANITATTINNLTATCAVIVSSNAVTKSITYQTHVENVGWQDWKSDGDMSGTSGKGLRLEGIKIKLNNYDNLGIDYQTHIQNIGWESDTGRGWKSDGDMSGTQGLAYRLEAIQIKLTGTDAAKYDIYYHVHAQNVGWMGWAKNGESSGTAGYGYRLEGIEIKIVAKGDPAPSNNVTYTNPFKENTDEKIMDSIVGQWTDGKNHIYFQTVNKTSLNGAIQFKDIRDGMTGRYRILGVNGNVLNISVYDQVNGGITLTTTNFSIDTGTQGDGIINFWGKPWTYVSNSPIFNGQ